MNITERFASKYRVLQTGCWEWTASTTGVSGYGRFYVDRERGLVLAHRYAYETTVGPIPEGLDLDHLCRNRLCCNPKHLEPVTRRENVVRGSSPNALNAAKTHCKRGHPLTKENCYPTRWPNQRQCRICGKLDQAIRNSKIPRKYRRNTRPDIQTNNLSSAERNASALRKAIEELS